ncbi:hypothetical protein NG767_03090 [Aliarcobacter cryaerophilus]|uniref:hypothetical protein n=1 Tax=Aliarcobacter cryaerophilus TaxID=28198 RepID=UPI003DA466A4
MAALSVVESQGTQAYLIPTGTAITTAAEIKTALATAKKINCLMDIGDVSLGSKSVQEYTCMSSDNSFKSLGSVSLANITPQLLFKPDDTAGQDDLRDMWNDNTRRIMIIELNDQITPTTGNPTYITFEAAISSPTIGIAKDNAVMYNPTIEICTTPSLILAS